VSPDSRQAGTGDDLMRASDVDRDRTIEVLAEASAQGRLNPQEYSERSEAALGARTLGDLAGLTADLPESRRAVNSSGAVAVIPEEITAVLGNETRKGRWVVPPQMNVRSVLGDCHLEMQQAVIEQKVTTINARVRLGSVTVYVPDGVDVRLTGRAVLGQDFGGTRRTRARGAGAGGALRRAAGLDHRQAPRLEDAREGPDGGRLAGLAGWTGQLGREGLRATAP
jgi:hypothetical protein